MCMCVCVCVNTNIDTDPCYVTCVSRPLMDFVALIGCHFLSNALSCNLCLVFHCGFIPIGLPIKMLKVFCVYNLREKILTWTRIRTPVSRSTRWRYNH